MDSALHLIRIHHDLPLMDLAALLPLVITTSIVLVVLGLGLNATWQEASYLFRHPRLLGRSLLSMNVIMPLVAAGLVVALELPTSVKVALVALSVSPVPPLIPGKGLRAGGDADYAIGLFVAIALLAIITVPVTVSLLGNAFDRAAEVAPLEIARSVLITVLAPLAIGIALRQWLPAVAQRFARPIALLGIVLLVVGVLPLAYAFWPAVRALFGDGTVLAIAAMAAIGLGVGHLLGGPHADHRTVLALSTTSRHPAVALAVAVAGGLESKAAVAAILLYVVVAALFSIPYVAWRKRLSVTSAQFIEQAPRSPR